MLIPPNELWCYFMVLKKKKFVGTALSFSLLKKSCLSIMQMFCFPFFNSPSADIYSFFHVGFGHFWRNLFLEVSRFCLFPIVNEIFELYPDFSSYSFSTSICWQVLAVLSASEIYVKPTHGFLSPPHCHLFSPPSKIILSPPILPTAHSYLLSRLTFPRAH